MLTQPVRQARYGLLDTSIFTTNEALGAAAAAEATKVILAAVAERGVAHIILATGNSQLTFLAALRDTPHVPWQAVNVFHMDEYIDLPRGHPASFPAFLHRHIIDAVKPKAFYPVPGDAPGTDAACREYDTLLRTHPADLCAMGICENGHIAFNDPPYAMFDDPVWVKPVQLDERSRQQQVGEGHFSSLDEAPTHAITLTIPALLSARRILCIVPEARKAEAVKRCLLGPITEACPGSVLRQTPHAHLFLDRDSAALL